MTILESRWQEIRQKEKELEVLQEQYNKDLSNLQANCKHKKWVHFEGHPCGGYTCKKCGKFMERD